jgi:peptidase M28-like protein
MQIDETLLTRLAAVRRPSASPGSRRAAQLIAAELTDAGARVRIEEESVHGTYWLPLGLLQAAAVAASRLPGPLGRRRAANVVAELGPPDAARTVVVHAHHDAAHSGLVFNPAIPRRLAGAAPGLARRLRTTPPVLWAGLAAPALAIAGATLDSRRLRRAAAAAGLGFIAAMGDIARAPTVPGACDNLSGVTALAAIARELAGERLDVRLLLLSTDSEESFLEGMKAFLSRHRATLPRDRTVFICLESVGSEQLVLLDGEGMLRLHRYPPQPRGALLEQAHELAIPIEPRFRFRFATDGQVALLAGYPVATVASIDWYRAPRNYHWPSDDAAHVDPATAARAAAIVTGFVRGQGS